LPMQGLFVHVRTATGEVAVPGVERDPDDVSEVHPYEGTKFWLMMNGILLNYSAGEKHKMKYSNADTSYLAGAIEYSLRNSVIQAMATVAVAAAVKDSNAKKWPDLMLIKEQLLAAAIEGFEGQQACVMFDKESSTFYVWRVMSTLYVGVNTGAGKKGDYMLFSSAKVPGYADNLLPEGQLIRVGPEKRELHGAASFKFTTPYATEV